MINFGRSVNRVVIPELSELVVLQSVANAQKNLDDSIEAKKMTALDFYYNDDLEKYVEAYFNSDSLKQVPVFPQSMVPRFARARMMLYKKAPKRVSGNEINEAYKMMSYHIDSQTRTFSELAWLLGSCHMKSRYNERKDRLEYEILPNVKEYFLDGESEPYGYSWEVERVGNKRKYVFWSESRNGVDGMHFNYYQYGKRTPIAGNPEMINPYGINPISKVSYPSNALDVITSAIQISIIMTEIALGVRFKLGQPVFTGVDEGQSVIKAGIENAIILPEGGSFQYVSPSGSMMEMIEAVKAFANITAENNHLRIRWGESGGNAPSGEALRIMEIENMESRESDIPLFKEFEHMRYEIDRTILSTHNVLKLPEDFSVDFGEVEYPMSVDEEMKILDWKLSHGIITKRDLHLHFNPDMSNEELDAKMNESLEEKREEVKASQPASPTFGGLRKLGKDNQ